MVRPRRSKHPIALACLAAVACAPDVVRAQVDASWVGPATFTDEPLIASQPGPLLVLNQGHDWSNIANWSAASFPSGGGLADIAQPGGDASVDRAARLVITLDTNIALREIRLANPGGIDVTDTQPAINASISTDAQGLIVRAFGTPNDAPSRAALDATIHNIDVPITGPAGVTVTGNAAIALGHSNSFAGPVSVSTGILTLTNRSGNDNYDARFGTGTAPLQFNASTLRWTHFGSGAAAAAELNRDLEIGPAGMTISLSATLPVAVRGIISGTGPLLIERDSAVLAAVNSYTGPTIFSGRTLTLAGSIAESPAIESTGTILLTRGSTGTEHNRIGDSASVSLHGGVLVMQTLGAMPASESVGTIAVGGGVNTVRFAGVSAPMTLHAAHLTRTSRGGLFLDGASVGTGSNSFLIGNAASLLVGGGGATGSTSQSIIPWAWAYFGNAGTGSNGSGRASFVTAGTAGLRPLDLSAEYSNNIVVASPDDNVRITGAQTVAPAGRHVNALLLGSTSNSDTGTPSSLTGGTVTIASGALLSTTRGNSVFTPMQFGASEAVIISASTSGSLGDEGLTIWGSIAGTGGLTKLGAGNLLLAGTNTYTGPTTLGAGRTTIFDDVSPGAPGPLGASNDPIIFIAGGSLPGQFEPGNQTRLTAQRPGTALSIGRPIFVRGQTHASAVGALLDSVSSSGTLNIDGGVVLESVQAPLGVARGNVNFRSSISGPGRFRDFGPAVTTFALSNPDWTGGLELGLTGAPAAVQVASDEALGTGPIYFAPTSRSTLRAVGGPVVLTNATTFAPAIGDSVVRLEGELTLAGPVSFAGSVGRPIAVAAGSAVTLAGSAGNGSFRLLADSFGGAAVSSGTLSIVSETQFDGRILVGAPAFGGSITPPRAQPFAWHTRRRSATQGFSLIVPHRCWNSTRRKARLAWSYRQATCSCRAAASTDWARFMATGATTRSIRMYTCSPMPRSASQWVTLYYSTATGPTNRLHRPAD